MRPDRIIVGECRGPEILDMFQAMNTGHEGSMTTVHANSPRELMVRLETMIGMSGAPMSNKAILTQIGMSVHLVVDCERYPDGTRKVAEIVEIAGLEGQTIIQAPLFRFERTGYAENGTVEGKFVSTGYRPRFFETLEKQGFRLPANLLKE
jgi:pilus assembly protein CpaF